MKAWSPNHWTAREFFSLSDLICSSLGPSKLLQMVLFCSLLWLSSIPLYSYLLSIYLSNVRVFFFLKSIQWNNAICSNIDGLAWLSILNRVRQTKATIICHLYVKSKKIIQINLFTKQKQTHRHKNNLTVTKGDGSGGINFRSLESTYIHCSI